MKNLPLCLMIMLLVVLGLLLTVKENFSASGLAISDEYCDKLAQVYLDPSNKDPAFRAEYEQRLCGNVRRRTIDHKTGNYYTVNGVLV